jgi:pyruvate/2-oxoglutarate dehydrogenase complex dihydrolipoamide acyltransferase (E2) component
MFRHMGESSKALATTTSTFTVRMERIEELISDLRAEPAGPTRSGVGVLAIAATCVARTLSAHPRINATIDFETDDLCLHRPVHLGVAVASPSGLVVPVLRNADRMRIDEVGDGIAKLAAKARDGSLIAADLRGGTFTVSSTGGLERGRVTSTGPIINLPQVAILWMSRIRDEPVVDDGTISPGRVMSCSLSFDHRYIDGAEATGFINDLTFLIEHPVRVLL